MLQLFLHAPPCLDGLTLQYLNTRILLYFPLQLSAEHASEMLTEKL
jgi:hypothetical protein